MLAKAILEGDKGVVLLSPCFHSSFHPKLKTAPSWSMSVPLIHCNNTSVCCTLGGAGCGALWES